MLFFKYKIRSVIFLLFIFTHASFCFGQMDLPASNMYLMNVSFEKDSLVVNDLKLMTAFNIDGYNNQPHFVNNDEVYFVSNASDPLRTNIFVANLSSLELRRLTSTKQSSLFSPYMANDESAVYSVRAHDDGGQYLTAMHFDKPSAPTVLLGHLDNIGYFLPLDGDGFIVFKVGDPHELWQYDLDSNSSTGLAINVGRCFKHYMDNKILFTQTLSNGSVVLKSLDLYSRKSEIIANMPYGSVDFAIGHGGMIYCTSGSEILKLNQTDRLLNKWSVVCNMSRFGLNNLTRIEWNPDGNKLIVVQDEVAN